MQRQARTLGCLFLLAAFWALAAAQGNETIVYRPEKARHLSGEVTDATGRAISGAVVEDCDLPNFDLDRHIVTIRFLAKDQLRIRLHAGT